MLRVGPVYAVGFTPLGLAGLNVREMPGMQVKLARVEYDPDAQRTLVQRATELANDAFAYVLRETSVDDALEVATHASFIGLVALVSTMKSTAFQEEAEWRVIVYDQQGRGSPNLRVGRYGLAHYMRLEFNRDSAISEIVHGPKHSDASVSETQAVVDNWKIGGSPKLTRSAARYR